ncbi:hypothetical protein P375_05965 [Gallibacterium genomosp. 2]|uniref:Uncharacterized protein n=2 Tax=Gallibacterium TaxID=155493 RepID=F4HBX2_GALAU|nr:hypothetical protein UMN179_00362 [Gallibacterium anatis UMN179]KGQ32339.1 hypothetical protein P375_05965 [Gallibacterium genomosp. 2]KGQ32729.1 hypothetical protein JP34_09170 [Gallibacterium anatis]
MGRYVSVFIFSVISSILFFRVFSIILDMEPSKQIDDLNLNNYCYNFELQRNKGQEQIKINRDSEIIIQFTDTSTCKVTINN